MRRSILDWRRRALRIGSDRRGVVSLAFGVAGVGVTVTAALATEGGAWYVAKTRAQTAADLAAEGAAAVLGFKNDASTASNAGVQVATANGFTAGGGTSVSVNVPPVSGSYAGNASAAEATISQVQTRWLSRLVLGSDPVVGARAVAVLQSLGNACVLATSGGLIMTGNSVTTGSGCVLASNATGASAIAINGSATVTAYSLQSAGGCSGCGGSGVTLTRPYGAYQPPATNPYAYLDSKTLPNFSGSTCINPPNNPTTLTPYETNGHKAYCSDIKVTGTSTLTLTPGTYYLWNASLSVQSGTVNCPTCVNGAGVTFVFTGNVANKIGGPNINANASVTLNAPSVTTNGSDPDFLGILFYRVASGASGNQGNTAVNINGGANTVLSGGMYFPSSYVKYNGNQGTAMSTCNPIVGQTIDFSGNGNTRIDTSGCAAAGTPVGQIRVVKLVQ